jgi:hypothetical protein
MFVRGIPGLAEAGDIQFSNSNDQGIWPTDRADHHYQLAQGGRVTAQPGAQGKETNFSRRK